MTVPPDFKTANVLLGIVAILGIIAPGFLILYQFQPELFERVGNLKLILFSISLTFPLMALNFLLNWTGRGLNIKEPTRHDIEKVIFETLLYSCLVLYATLLASYFLSLRFYSFAAIIALIEVGLAMSCFNSFKSEVRKKREEPVQEQKKQPSV